MLITILKEKKKMSQEKNPPTSLLTKSSQKGLTSIGKVENAVEVFNNELVISTNHVSSLTPEKAKDSAQLSLIRKQLGEKEAGLMITKVLNEISLMTNTTMDTPVKMLCAKMILANYWNIKIDELLLIIRDGILGRYGKIYGNFCFTTLTEWIEKYQQEKTGACESESLQYTGHEKVERPKSAAFEEKNYDLPPISKHIEDINNFWRENGNEV